MYKRQVVVSLLIMIVVAVGAAVVANTDPFRTTNVWGSWAALAGTGVVGSFVGLITVIFSLDKSDKDYFVNLAGATGVTAIAAAILTGVVASRTESLYTGLMWASYATLVISLIVNGLIAYLVADDSAQAAERRLSRVA